MLTFFAEPSLAQAVRHRVAEHQRLDQIVQRSYWSNGKGCFIGCSLHSADHSAFERLLGLPTWLAYLAERIFESLPRAEALDFPLALYDAIPVGAEIDSVRDEFLIRLLRTVIQRADERCRVAISDVIALFERRLAGNEPTTDQWAAAGAAAWATGAAAGDASGAAAWAGDASGAAWCAGDSWGAGAAARATGAAAWAAAWATAGVAAGDASGAAIYRQQRDWLIELLCACKPVVDAQPELPSDPVFVAYRLEVMAEAVRGRRAAQAAGAAP